MKKIITALVLVVSFSFAGKGTVYSRFGVGEINLFSSGRSAGMGNTGIGLLDNTSINLSNPAAIGTIARTMLTAGYQFQSFSSADAGGSSVFGTGNINSFAIAFPVYTPKNMVLSLAALPFSSVGYEQQIESTFDATTIYQTFDGRGGISSAQLSLSYAPASDLMVGATMHYLFGAIFNDQVISFSGSNYYNASVNQTLSCRGFGFTLGGIYSGIDQALGMSASKNVNLGMTLFTGSSMTLDNESLNHYSSNTDTVSAGNQSLELPFGVSFGLAYALNNVNYTADVNFQNWDSYKIAGVHPSEIQNSFRIGAGVEFLPAKDFTDSYWQKLAYRFGGYFRQTNVKVNGQSINEIFGTAGVGLPISVDSRMNVGLEYGIRGTTSASLIRDTVLKFVISLSASETMFIQPPVE